ncbi:MAG TPA: sulfite exporter TauE/SafE family protein [Gammaproteobacteria bacterium]|nr:sulfite exporter TauE/SafE family protein [Gammaproteobacteria bacterium]
MFYLAYALLGLFAGLLAGLLGVGGGLVIVPVLAWLFALQGFPAAVLMQLAVGTSLATIVATSLSSIRAHHVRGGVVWPQVLQLGSGILAGAWLGAWIAHRMSSPALATLFGLFELGVAAQMAFGRPPAPHRGLAAAPVNAAAGGVIGAVSAVLGIGGGTLTVPWLAWHNLPMRQAVGTAAACGLPIALAGAAGFVASGWRVAGLPAGSSGYVYWPAALAVSAVSVLAAPLGARLAHRLPQRVLKRVFAGFVALLGVLMLSRPSWT